MKRTIPDTASELCLSLPGTEQTSTHGKPTFKVAGKAFAHFVVNHHGDARVALWLNVGHESQARFTDLGPDAYFVPPYVGPRGWLGVELNKGLAWQEVVARVREAYEHSAPAKLLARLPEAIAIDPPNVEMTPEDIDPMLGAYPQEILAGLRERCSRLPEAAADADLGGTTWKAGKKTFVRSHHREGRMKLLFWVGVELQPFLVEDPRYAIPMYYGSSGWIELDVQERVNWDEIAGLLENSYRHFALQRMLKALDEG